MTTLTINFTTRETYINWRAQWRAEYKAVSQLIRETKNNLKQAMRDDKLTDQWKLWSTLFRARKEATDLLVLRADSKIESNRQYLAQKESVLS